MVDWKRLLGCFFLMFRFPAQQLLLSPGDACSGALLSIGNHSVQDKPLEHSAVHLNPFGYVNGWLCNHNPGTYTSFAEPNTGTIHRNASASNGYTFNLNGYTDYDSTSTNTNTHEDRNTASDKDDNGHVYTYDDRDYFAADVQTTYTDTGFVKEDCIDLFHSSGYRWPGGLW